MVDKKIKTQRQLSAGIIICHPVTKKILLVRKSRGGRWEWPKGKIEPREKTIAAARREVKEEVGLKNIRIVPGFQHIVRYRFRVGQLLINKTVSLYIGFGTGRVRLSGEHTAYRWDSFSVAGRRVYYQNQRAMLRLAWDYLRSRGYLPDRKNTDNIKT